VDKTRGSGQILYEINIHLKHDLILYNVKGNKCIRVLGFWRLKLGFRHIVSFSAEKCDLKVRFYKPCIMAASESEFDHANRILRLKVGVLVLYSVKIIKMSRLAINHFLIL